MFSVPSEEANTTVPVSDNADKHEQSDVSETKPVTPTQLPDVSSAQSDNDEEESKNVSSHSPATIRKDAMYQGSLENIPLYKKNIDDYHRQIIVTCEAANQTAEHPSSTTTGAVDVENIRVKGFIGELKSEVGIRFLADGAFLLFTISNFLTSLGFNVPYNFAHDLAKDAQVVEDHREYVIMSIGLSNAIGRIIIGFLGDREKVFIIYISYSWID